MRSGYDENSYPEYVQSIFRDVYNSIKNAYAYLKEYNMRQEYNLYYITQDGRSHVLEKSFSALNAAEDTIAALRTLSRVIAISLRSPFTQTTLYDWNLFTGSGRFL